MSCLVGTEVIVPIFADKVLKICKLNGFSDILSIYLNCLISYLFILITSLFFYVYFKGGLSRFCFKVRMFLFVGYIDRTNNWIGYELIMDGLIE